MIQLLNPALLGVMWYKVLINLPKSYWFCLIFKLFQILCKFKTPYQWNISNYTTNSLKYLIYKVFFCHSIQKFLKIWQIIFWLSEQKMALPAHCTVVRGWEKNYLLMFENYRIFVLMKSSNISKNQGTGHFAKIIHFRWENSKIKFVV